MPDFSRKLNVRGNPYALARLVAIACCLFAAVVMGFLGQVSLGALFGSFFGAALSLGLNWVVTTLEKPESDDAPPELVAAIGRQLGIATYYRRNQTIEFKVEKDQNEKINKITLVLSADIIPFRREATINHPSVKPPSGVKEISSEYFVNTSSIRKGDGMTIYSPTTDRFMLVYEVTDQNIECITDDHRWPCPTLDYIISYKPQPGCRLEVSVAAASTQPGALDQRIRRNGTVEFLSGSAAFTQQGIQWTLRMT